MKISLFGIIVHSGTPGQSRTIGGTGGLKWQCSANCHLF